MAASWKMAAILKLQVARTMFLLDVPWRLLMTSSMLVSSTERVYHLSAVLFFYRGNTSIASK